MQKNKLSQSEENYLKSIFHLTTSSSKSQVSTNDIANDLNTKASSVTEMIKKLSRKGLIEYQKYKGSKLTKEGANYAIKIVRKHRLWETFLVDILQFTWDEVHDIAEQLEHIQSEKLTDRLSNFLNHPQFDPHGDPIPDGDGNFPVQESIKILKLIEVGEKGEVVSISLDDKAFLGYLTQHDIKIGTIILCNNKFEFDGSITVKIDGAKEINLSKKVVKNIIIK